MRRRWPWVAWAAAGVTIEVYAIASGRVDPLTRIIGSLRSHWVGRLIYAAVAGASHQHFIEA